MSFPASVDTWVRVLTLLPIAACSIVGLALALAKWRQLRRSARLGARALLHVRGLIRAHEYPRALAVVQADSSHAARLVERTLEMAPTSPDRLTRQVEQTGRELARELDYGLGGLALIATLGPLLGLFGTVVGIVVVFDRLAGAEGLVNPQQLADGIGTALYTTVAGLIVGMCALVSHRYLAALADSAIGVLEAIGQELVDLVHEGDP